MAPAALRFGGIPIATATDMHSDLRERILLLVESGTLPLILPDQAWAYRSPHHGSVCAACERPIDEQHCRFDAWFRTRPRLFLHWFCAEEWLREAEYRSFLREAMTESGGSVHRRRGHEDVEPPSAEPE